MRRILHLDLDAFFAAVEQRDKPSLRGKPVVVGGSGPRGVVATASYEARKFGVRSAMSGTEARRRAPHAAFLGGRFQAYRASSRVVMGLLREVSPLVEPLSLDEAFVDLEPSGWPDDELGERVEWLRAELERRTEGLTASVGVGSAKFLAKLASEAAKPNGHRILRPEEELDFLAPLAVRAIPGVGPATEQRLVGIGLHIIEDLRGADRKELVRELGQSAGESLAELAWGRDPRRVQPQRDPKSISTEDTFAVDLTDRGQLEQILRRDSADVARRLTRAGFFARTVTLKVRFADFTTRTIARSLGGATADGAEIAAEGISLLGDVDIRAGVRLLGIGVSNFVTAAQEKLFDLGPGSAAGAGGAVDVTEQTVASDDTGAIPLSGVRGQGGFYPGADVEHDEHGRGWVWGSGLGRVTVRFESRHSGRGRIATFPVDDPALHPADPEPLAFPLPDEDAD
ncbi:MULTISPECIES: DNA polymerase IV [unclassified Tessaracoccus]|uniref:DNA polymerase IV n=1 Tax=unclassified Tessaracoccus TaxID=2635419 RepID=UPI00096C7A78|nr:MULTISPECIES: DNA polymerase IV [unclassified Tessaracoccus]MBB1509350.1 DNA polymerase IV [Tessaracoccus sp. MC1756]MCG6567082.1 DNA polymerase IV [Tessaracoccus sp. ZS01]OMG57487.1 DNA polymerase IV [Tessaracoccus sp. ZS01]